jgi:hypothetical protein
MSERPTKRARLDVARFIDLEAEVDGDELQNDELEESSDQGTLSIN